METMGRRKNKLQEENLRGWRPDCLMDEIAQHASPC